MTFGSVGAPSPPPSPNHSYDQHHDYSYDPADIKRGDQKRKLAPQKFIERIVKNCQKFDNFYIFARKIRSFLPKSVQMIDSQHFRLQRIVSANLM